MRGFVALHWLNKAHPSSLQPEHEQTPLRLSSEPTVVSFHSNRHIFEITCPSGLRKQCSRVTQIVSFLTAATDKVCSIFAARLEVGPRMTFDLQSFMGKICRAAERAPELKSQVIHYMNVEEFRGHGRGWIPVNHLLLVKRKRQLSGTAQAHWAICWVASASVTGPLLCLFWQWRPNQLCCCCTSSFCHYFLGLGHVWCNKRALL